MRMLLKAAGIAATMGAALPASAQTTANLSTQLTAAPVFGHAHGFGQRMANRFQSAAAVQGSCLITPKGSVWSCEPTFACFLDTATRLEGPVSGSCAAAPGRSRVTAPG